MFDPNYIYQVAQSIFFPFRLYADPHKYYISQIQAQVLHQHLPGLLAEPKHACVTNDTGASNATGFQCQ